MKTDKRLEDLTGQTFYNWTVLRLANKQQMPNGRYRTMWHCICKCGTEKDVAAASLKNGSTKSCGCHKSNRLHRNLIGQQFGKWLVIDEADYVITGSRRWRAWLCKCSCGTIRVVTENSLLCHKSTSCGCYRLEQISKSNTRQSLIGLRFGKLTVLRELPSKKFKGGGYAQMWECICDCGNLHQASGNLMKSGLVRSCGCTKESNLELDTKQVLTDFNFKFVQQYAFDDLVGVNNGCLLFDFVVFDNGKPLFAVECQGEQHYKSVSWFGGKDAFAVQKEHDLRKQQYCNKLGIPLFEIPYTCYNKSLVHKCLFNLLKIYQLI